MNLKGRWQGSAQEFVRCKTRNACPLAQGSTQGVPLAMIAEQLGHSDTRITERNYSHLAKSVVADTVRAAFGELGIVEPDNVTALK